MAPAREPADSLGAEARRIVREARLAQEGDSLTAVAARWSVRLATDPADRTALLGLATAARLANDDSTAIGLSRRLLGAPDTGVYAAYAHLGKAKPVKQPGLF